MAWFIVQSLAMIVLAFLLGVLVGWIIWGRRLRVALGEIRMLRASVADCEANHGKAATPVAAPVTAESAPVHIPTPRAEVADASELDVSSVHASSGLDEVMADDFESADDLDALYNMPPVADAERVNDVGPVDDVEPVNDAHAVDEQKAADDLIRIEGIGPRIAAALIAAGIDSYRALADSDEATLTRAIRKARVTFAPSLATWPQQARLLADGDEQGFVALTDRIIAGRTTATARTAAAAAAQNGAPATTSLQTAPDAVADAGSQPEAGSPPDMEPQPKAGLQPEAGSQPEAASGTMAPDDLARIEGIGPKIASALVTAGIRTFGQLADAPESAQRDAINAAGIKFAPSIATWSEQARLLADGHEDEFAVLTARLIAGRRANDDLQRIEGIGPRMEAALQASGIRTYRALADSSDAKLRNAIAGSGLKFAPSIVTWSRQARLLADGDEEGFTDLTRRLVAGRDEGRA